MSEVNQLAELFLAAKNKDSGVDKGALTPHNSFRALFDCKEMSDKEIKEMQELFHLTGTEDEEAVRLDFKELVQITSELKAIQKQAILLMGERIFRVRDIFRKYDSENGSFTTWLDTTFNSKKSAYNALAFYDLYSKLPTDEMRENFKKMPARAGYILASRHGDEAVKHTIISHYQGERQKELIERIEEKLPPRKGDLRSSRDLAGKTLDEIERLIHVLDRRAPLVHKSDLDRVEKMILRLRSLIDTFS